ncbi:MAG: aminodeoxychorismate synthase component I [Erythrobacter sp.]
MGEDTPFILLDDARQDGAAAALLYERPRAIFTAHRSEQVEQALADAAAAQERDGGSLAGYIAYEAGLALEQKLQAFAAPRTGANGPLVWLGLFDQPEEIDAPAIPAWLAARSDGEASLGPMEPQLSPGGYTQAFDTLQEAIRAGDIYQANLTYPLAGSYNGDPIALYKQLRSAANAGYGGIVFDGSHWLLSFSPELFVATNGREAKAKPMKGTRPRNADSAIDAELAQDLASSVKDKAENLMIVDLMRNDLGRVAEAGSVRVEQPFAIESYPSVHQMVSTVRARLEPDIGLSELVKALFPCGSITGAPKIRAMELIGKVERDARGPYCGAIGRVDEAGDAAFNVAIRTLRLTPIENNQGTAILGVGSAIVADSDAMAERRECEVKAGFVRQSSAPNSAPQFDLLETMRFEPESGIELLEGHLSRLKASAAELGFSFDRHAARNQIQALCFELETAVKVRLVLARSGAIALEASALPQPLEGPAHCIALPLAIDPSDFRLRHKTSDRSFYEEALAAAKGMNADEALLIGENSMLTEGSFTNIFVDDGAGVLLTPPASLGLLPGVLRANLIELGKAREAELTLGDLAGGFLLGNAARGLFPAQLKS